jgi:hypothetical protein
VTSLDPGNIVVGARRGFSAVLREPMTPEMTTLSLLTAATATLICVWLVATNWNS